MKISWGYKIAGAYLLFVAGILFLVYKANQQHFDLVTDNYYEEELKYQNVIDQKERVAGLSVTPRISFEKGALAIRFPQEFSNSEIKGELYLYRPSDARKDIRKNISGSGTDYTVLLPEVQAGLYDIKLSWQSGGQSYFYEQKKFFQP